MYLYATGNDPSLQWVMYVLVQYIPLQKTPISLTKSPNSFLSKAHKGTRPAAANQIYTPEERRRPYRSSRLSDCFQPHVRAGTGRPMYELHSLLASLRKMPHLLAY